MPYNYAHSIIIIGFGQNQPRHPMPNEWIKRMCVCISGIVCSLKKEENSNAYCNVVGP